MLELSPIFFGAVRKDKSLALIRHGSGVKPADKFGVKLLSFLPDNHPGYFPRTAIHIVAECSALLYRGLLSLPSGFNNCEVVRNKVANSVAHK